MVALGLLKAHLATDFITDLLGGTRVSVLYYYQKSVPIKTARLSAEAAHKEK